MTGEIDVTKVGRITRTHGVKGEVVLALDDDVYPSSLECLFLDMDGIDVPFFTNNIRERGDGTLLVTFDGIDSEAAASELVGKNVSVQTELLEDDEEDDDDNIYLSDLIGYTMLDTDDSVAGTIEDFDDSTDNTLFIIKTKNGETAYVPAADDLIRAIDSEAKTITVDIPAGLI